MASANHRIKAGLRGVISCYAVLFPNVERLASVRCRLGSFPAKFTFNARCVSQQDLARACKEVSDHSKLLPGVDGSHRSHVVAKWAEDAGQDLIKPTVRPPGHKYPAPIFRIADAFCVAGFDEPVNDSGDGSCGQPSETGQFTCCDRTTREQIEALAVSGAHTQATANKIVKHNNSSDKVAAEQGSCFRIRREPRGLCLLLSCTSHISHLTILIISVC